MQKFYMTFGTGHFMYGKIALMIEAHDWKEAYDKANRIFGDKFCTIYQEEQFNKLQYSYPVQPFSKYGY